MNLAVDVISDVICPWCYIGKRRLKRAVAAIEGQHEVLVRWLPFQLNPTMPKEGINHVAALLTSSQAARHCSAQSTRGSGQARKWRRSCHPGPRPFPRHRELPPLTQ